MEAARRLQPPRAGLAPAEARASRASRFTGAANARASRAPLPAGDRRGSRRSDGNALIPVSQRTRLLRGVASIAESAGQWDEPIESQRALPPEVRRIPTRAALRAGAPAPLTLRRSAPQEVMVEIHSIHRQRLVCTPAVTEELHKLHGLQVRAHGCVAPQSRAQPHAPRAAAQPARYVTVEVHGGGRFRSVVGRGQPFNHGSSHTTKVVEKNGCTPRWDDEIDCVVDEPDDAILSLHLYDKGRAGSELIAYQCLPMSAMRQGWRVIRMRSPTGSRLVLGSVLVHLQFEQRKGMPANAKGAGKNKRQATNHPRQTVAAPHTDSMAC